MGFAVWTTVWLAEDAVSCEPVSGQKFPLTGKFTGNFDLVTGPDRVYASVNTGVNGFPAEIVTEDEQGNNRRDNRENMQGNRRVLLCSILRYVPIRRPIDWRKSKQSARQPF